jgi:hypothetical protein
VHSIPLYGLQETVPHVQATVFGMVPSMFSQVLPLEHVLEEESQ